MTEKLGKGQTPTVRPRQSSSMLVIRHPVMLAPDRPEPVHTNEYSRDGNGESGTVKNDRQVNDASAFCVPSKLTRVAVRLRLSNRGSPIARTAARRIRS